MSATVTPFDPAWVAEPCFTTFLAEHHITLAEVRRGCAILAVQSQGYFGGTLQFAYRKVFERQVATGFAHSTAHRTAVVTVAGYGLLLEEVRA